jgi:hypothetical protein
VRRLSRSIVVVALLLFAMMACIAASASAASKVHVFKETFGSSTQPTFGNPISLAVDQVTGDLLVANNTLATLSRFKPNGDPDPFSALGTNVIDGKGSGGGPGSGHICVPPSAECDETPENNLRVGAFPGRYQIAIDNSGGATQGNIYITGETRQLIYVFAPDGHWLGNLTAAGATHFGTPTCGVAVGSGGTVYVGDKATSFVHKFIPTANPPINTDKTNDFSTSQPCNVAAGTGPTAGFLFVNKENGSVSKLNSTTGAFKYFVAEGAHTVTTVNPASGNVYTSSGSEVLEYDASGATEAILISTLLAASTIQGVAVNESTGNVYITRTGSTSVEVFSPAVSLPLVQARGPPSNITPTKATLKGDVNPEGLAVTECKFEYLTNAAYVANGNSYSGPNIPATKACEGSIPTDSTLHAVTGAVTGLLPNTTYHYRVVAKNVNGTNSGLDQTFVTANDAITGGASSITGTKATVNGTVLPEGLAVTECKFEYGLTTAYGSSKPCAEAISTDEAEHPVTAALTGLSPNGTIYHYRLAINGGGGSAQGADKTFATAGTVITGPATAIADTAATLNGTVKPEGVALSECKFEYGLTTAYGSSKPCVPAFGSIPGDFEAHAVSANLTGLTKNATYHFRLVAANASWTANGSDETFTTFGPPRITEEVASPVETSTATLLAKVNPSGLATTYHFEWGATPSYGTRIPTDFDPFAGAGTLPVKVPANLTGLQPATTYHFRLVATNSSGTTNGPDQEFTTLNSAGLPDNRAYELVSPADKRPEGLVEEAPVTLELSYQAAADGQSFYFPILGGLANSTSGGQVNYLAARSPSGWQSTQVTPPTLVPNPIGLEAPPSYYEYYSPSLSCGLVATGGPLTSDTPSADLELGVSNFYRRNSDGSYTLLSNAVPANLAATAALPREQLLSGAQFYEAAGTSASCSQVFFKSLYQFLPGSPSGLYEWDNGTLRDAGLLPNGSAGGRAGVGARIPALSGEVPHEKSSYNSVSSGGHFFFTAKSNEGGDQNQTAVFARKGSAASTGAGDTHASTLIDNVTGSFAVGETITGTGIPAGTTITAVNVAESKLSLSRPATGTAHVTLSATEVTDVSQSQTAVPNTGSSRYETASPDGSHVYFTAKYGLAASSSTGPLNCDNNTSVGLGQGCDLYDYNVGPGPGAGTLTDLSADTNPADATNGATVKGVVAVSDNGSYVYFAAQGQLVSGRGSTYAQNTSNATANLYLAHGGALTYIATISVADFEGGSPNPDGRSFGDLMLNAQRWTAQSTPNGRTLLFTSKTNITGYESGGPQEAYIYSAEADKTTCVSCRPDGLPSHSSFVPPGLGAANPLRSDWTQYENGYRHPNSLSNDGSRVFFTMGDALAPGAIEGDYNLYEWEKGQIYLLFTTPRGEGKLGFVDSSTSGNDVFIRTEQQLDPRYDTDFVQDIYDIRINGGFSSPPMSPAPCDPAADQCQGAPTTTSGASSPASQGSGPGNLPTPKPGCPKGKIRKHGKCVKGTQSAKKHHKKSHKRAAKHNGGGAK